MKKTRMFPEPKLELNYRQLIRSSTGKGFGLRIVLFKMQVRGRKNQKRLYEKFSDWLLKCPEGIDYEVH